jgi:hypothetical protein
LIDLYTTYLRLVPWIALLSSPYGSFLKPNHNKRLIVHYDGDMLTGGGFVASGRLDVKPSYRGEFIFRKKVSATQWFVEQCEEIPSSWRKEHVSFFAGGRIFNMSCVTSSLPSTTSIEINYAPDHPIAINISRWAESNLINLHYASIAALEMSLQWYLGQANWAGDRELRFLLGHDGSQWFLAGASSQGLCAFHQMDHPFELSENVNGFYVTINPEILSQISYFAPGREDEANDAAVGLRDNYFPEIKIDSKPFSDITVSTNAVASNDALSILTSLLPRRITHG